MATYRIENSFDTGYGPRLDFSVAYDNDIEFESLSDEDALAKADELQEKHDAIYLAKGASDNDFNNAPCYVNCLFDDNGEKVEP